VYLDDFILYLLRCPASVKVLIFDTGAGEYLLVQADKTNTHKVITNIIFFETNNPNIIPLWGEIFIIS
jgi:hypothetical protein